jgi:undecaprenyl-diphosphatase
VRGTDPRQRPQLQLRYAAAEGREDAMTTMRATDVIRRFDAAELSLCVLLNRGCTSRPMREFFGAVSRLGDGILWYFLILSLPVLFGERGLLPALQMAVTGLIGVAIYKALKHTLVRERPFIQSDRIALGTAPLDRYSFPSGHTLHAVSFTTMCMSYFPELGVVLVPFALLVAASRVILGLHYPTDVLAGAALGFGLARTSLSLIGG